MKTKYNPAKFETKWQKFWEQKKLHRAKDFGKKPKDYLLVEFPYPSGEGLHVGHCRPYIALDVVARQKRMQAENVLFPMGWDAFGLPTENYAMKTGIHPSLATEKNSARFKKQQQMIGLSFDWSREINTTDPEYYKWTQWIFLQLFRKGLAYKAKMPINWCPSCKIGLANEEVVNGKCERCGSGVTKKDKEQWMLKITKYADRLLKDLEIVDYPERVKIAQQEWIGRSQGTYFEMPIFFGKGGKELKERLSVFTTRIDTVFGMTYVVLSAEHPLAEKVTTLGQSKEVEKYAAEAKNKMDLEKIATDKEKTGVFSGSYALNVFNNQKIPIYISDYVLINYGTGAIMAVPAHDERDYLFAKKYNLSIVEVIKPARGAFDIKKEAFVDKGVLTDSGQFTGLTSEQAIEKMTQWLEKEKKGRRAVYCKLRDWIFSRQHYWGEPIPMINCQQCGWQPMPEKDLPVKLPEVKKYQPTDTGESPLSAIGSWVNTKCPKCGGPAQRETDTMPNWAGSNWYFLRYCDPRNNERLADSGKLKYWLAPARKSPGGVGGVDWYNGGMEHTTLHLLYSRFIYKFLWDIGAVPKACGPEPYKKRTSHGIILGEGSVKMSKSRGNVVVPDEVIKRYGADTLRIYEMFMGPFEQMIVWDSKGVVGARRFLERVWKMQYKIESSNNQETITKNKLEKLLHQTIKKVSEDIEEMKFNTAVSTLMILANEMDKGEKTSKIHYLLFLILLAPFAPHIAEELWERLGNRKSIFQEKWPQYDKKIAKEEKIILVVQINGKVRDKIEALAGISEAEAKQAALASDKIKKWLRGKKPRKIIFVKGRLVNIVV